MTHEEYKEHLTFYINDEDPASDLANYEKETVIMVNLNTDPVSEIPGSTYSPSERGLSRRPPECILRSLILMTLCRETGITAWVKRTRREPVIAVLAGFTPGDTPGVGTYYDFMKRVINGTYRKP